MAIGLVSGSAYGHPTATQRPPHIAPPYFIQVRILLIEAKKYHATVKILLGAMVFRTIMLVLQLAAYGQYSYHGDALASDYTGVPLHICNLIEIDH